MKMIHCIIIFTALSLYSCITYKQTDRQALSAKEPGDVLIVMNDGRVIPGTDLKVLFNDRKPKNEIILDGKTYSVNDVIAYQTKDTYLRRTPYGYLKRLVRGNMNLYYREDVISSNNINTFFFDKPGQTATQIGIHQLRDAVKDNEAALALLNRYYPRTEYIRQLNMDKLVAIVKMYNK